MCRNNFTIIIAISSIELSVASYGNSLEISNSTLQSAYSSADAPVQ